MLEKTFNRLRGSIVASGIASIILGVLFLMNPVISGVSFCYFVGTMMAIAGLAKMIFSFIHGENIALTLVGGLLMFLFGLLCITRPDVLMDFLTILAGMYVVADGATSMSEGIACVRAKVSGGVLIVVFSIILMICGIYLMFAPFGFIMLMAGIVLIADGIFNLVFVGALRRQIDEAKKVLNEK